MRETVEHSSMGQDELSPRVARLLERIRSEMMKGSDPWSLQHVSIVRDDPTLASLSASVRQAHAIARVLREMPIEIAPDEIIVGNIPRHQRLHAPHPLPDHLTPAEVDRIGPTNHRGLMRSLRMGHYAANYGWLVEVGLEGVRAEARASLARLEGEADPDAEVGREFLEAVIVGLDGVRDFAERYAALAEEMASSESDSARRAELLEIAERCRHVPERPARTFAEGLQSFFLYHAVLQNLQHDAACGRLDQIFWPLLEADLDSGRLTLERAQELVDCLLIKLNDFVRFKTDDEWGTMEPGLQNVVLGGQALASGEVRDVTNELTYLFLNSARRLKFNNPTINVRLHDHSPERLVRACCEVMRSGGGFPALYNDEVFVPSLMRAGIPREDAYDYANDGCWESTIPGKTRFYYRNVSAPLCLEWTLTRGVGLPVDWKRIAGMRRDEAPTPAPASELSVECPDELIEPEDGRARALALLGKVNGQLIALKVAFTHGAVEVLDGTGAYEELYQRTCEQLASLSSEVAEKLWGPLYSPEHTWPNAVSPAIVTRHGGIDVGSPDAFPTFEDLFQAYLRQLDHAIADLAAKVPGLLGNGRELVPNVLGAALVWDSVARGRGWAAGGPRYTIFGFNVHGVANAADSLLAIQKLVYEDKVFTMGRLLELLRTNFEGAEAERQLLLTRAPHYGDGGDEGIAMAKRILDFAAASIKRHVEDIQIPKRHERRVIITMLSGTFGNTIVVGRLFGAMPDGRFASFPQAVNLAPVIGASPAGPTAILRSYAGLPQDVLSGGAPLDLAIDGAALRGEEGLERLIGFVRAFLELRGNLLTVTLVDAATLRAAQKDPSSYRDLRVRMGGWNAYFVALNREGQEHQIARAEHRSL